MMLAALLPAAALADHGIAEAVRVGRGARRARRPSKSPLPAAALAAALQTTPPGSLELVGHSPS